MKLQGEIGHVSAARGPCIVGGLLVTILLTGCNQAGTTSGQAAQSSSGATQPSSGTQAGSGSTTPSNKSADVSWTPPTTNTNGTALTNLAGYRIYYGTSSGTLTHAIDVPNAGATDYVVQGLTPGTWYFAVAAYTNSGLQSSLSSVASKTIT